MSRNINNFFTWADPRTKYESHIFPLQQIIVNSTRKKKKKGVQSTGGADAEELKH